MGIKKIVQLSNNTTANVYKDGVVHLVQNGSETLKLTKEDVINLAQAFSDSSESGDITNMLLDLAKNYKTGKVLHFAVIGIEEGGQGLLISPSSMAIVNTLLEDAMKGLESSIQSNGNSPSDQI